MSSSEQSTATIASNYFSTSSDMPSEAESMDSQFENNASAQTEGLTSKADFIEAISNLRANYLRDEPDSADMGMLGIISLYESNRTVSDRLDTIVSKTSSFQKEKAAAMQLASMVPDIRDELGLVYGLSIEPRGDGDIAPFLTSEEGQMIRQGRVYDTLYSLLTRGVDNPGLYATYDKLVKHLRRSIEAIDTVTDDQRELLRRLGTPEARDQADRLRQYAPSASNISVSKRARRPNAIVSFDDFLNSVNSRQLEIAAKDLSIKMLAIDDWDSARGGEKEIHNSLRRGFILASAAKSRKRYSDAAYCLSEAAERWESTIAKLAEYKINVDDIVSNPGQAFERCRPKDLPKALYMMDQAVYSFSRLKSRETTIAEMLDTSRSLRKVLAEHGPSGVKCPFMDE